jgi:hypothetical protein
MASAGDWHAQVGLVEPRSGIGFKRGSRERRLCDLGLSRVCPIERRSRFGRRLAVIFTHEMDSLVSPMRQSAIQAPQTTHCLCWFTRSTAEVDVSAARRVQIPSSMSKPIIDDYSIPCFV